MIIRNCILICSKQVPNPGALPSVVAASNEDFVIKQHTYQMCPNCPTFSIPIPVPQSAASQVSEVRFPSFSGKMLTIPPKVVNPYTIDPGYEYQHGEEPVSLFSRLSSFLSSFSSSSFCAKQFCHAYKSLQTHQAFNGFEINLVFEYENQQNLLKKDFLYHWLGFGFNCQWIPESIGGSSNPF